VGRDTAHAALVVDFSQHDFDIQVLGEDVTIASCLSKTKTTLRADDMYSNVIDKPMTLRRRCPTSCGGSGSMDVIDLDARHEGPHAVASLLLVNYNRRTRYWHLKCYGESSPRKLTILSFQGTDRSGTREKMRTPRRVAHLPKTESTISHVSQTEPRTSQMGEYANEWALTFAARVGMFVSSQRETP
jgi:hypothetical protein